MNVAVSDVEAGRAAAAAEPARVVLLGVGTVGSALLQRLRGWHGGPLAERLAERLSLVYVANSKVAAHLQAPRAGVRPVRPAGGDAPPSFPGADRPAGHPPFMHLLPDAGAQVHLASSALDNVAEVLGGYGRRILIDATASADVAGRHAEWLARGIHVVTACKLAQGTSLQCWREVQAASADGGAHYGDAATVGAGLPLLRSIRELRAGGDHVHGLAGVLSGSLAWLFNHYDGKRPFSGFVREARAAGYTEPDPREDLSGEDVRRKLLILARAAGVELEADAVEVESLVPAVLANAAADRVDDGLAALDAPLRQRFAQAYKRGEKLRFIARLQGGRARVGLEALSADDPLAGGAGTDNKLAIWSDRYREQPLVIQGPGAGAEVTAAALLDDALRIAAL